MIGRMLFNAEHDPFPAICGSDRCWTYEELSASSRRVANICAEFGGQRVGVWCSEFSAVVSTMAALDSLGATVLLFPASATEEQIVVAARELSLQAIVSDLQCDTARSGVRMIKVPATPQGPSAQAFQNHGISGKIVLFTSGTSGKPKPAIHTWDKLAAAVNREGRNARLRWFTAYDPTSFAGIQVWLQALCTGGSLYPLNGRGLNKIAQLIDDAKIECIAATPSFLRLFMMSRGPFSGSSVRQITIGGEIVDQPLLDALRAAFPEARITHIYASTEMGSCFAVRDGQAGFPVSYLTDRSLPCEIRVSDNGELQIRSRRAMLGYLNEIDDQLTGGAATEEHTWYSTGDLVSRQGDRYVFAGRRSETINVGGMKVYPPEVETCIQRLPEVELVRVYGIPSSITGQLVCADVQPRACADLATLRANIFSTCRQRLRRHQIPSIVNFKERLELSGAAKLLRSEKP